MGFRFEANQAKVSFVPWRLARDSWNCFPSPTGLTPVRGAMREFEWRWSGDCGQHGAGCGYFCFACAMCLEFVMMNALCRIFGLPLRWAGLQGIRCGAISMWHFDTAFGFLSTSMRMWTQPMDINTRLIPLKGKGWFLIKNCKIDWFEPFQFRALSCAFVRFRELILAPSRAKKLEVFPMFNLQI